MWLINIPAEDTRAQEHNNDNLRLLNLISGASLQLSLIQRFRSNSRLDIQKRRDESAGLDGSLILLTNGLETPLCRKEEKPCDRTGLQCQTWS